ncbi:MAG TPA: malate synthase A [Methylovirgula sp.]|nr:malate synthase A [Methylovirgula sp.]
MTRSANGANLRVTGPAIPGSAEILTEDALDLLETFVKLFGPRREALLRARAERQRRFDHGALPDFLPETRGVRESVWKIRDIPADLCDRRVEITGPTDRKMVINALNTPVKAFMADFEDSLAPTWANVIQGQINLRDAHARTITYDDPVSGKHYALNGTPCLLIARVRGLHLPEAHVLFEEKPIAGALFDFVLYLHHNMQRMFENGTGPYFYVPKLEHHEEARWWADVFDFAEDHAGLARGTIKATFLIETLPAAFQMDEILFAARDHAVGLNFGRWDYIFSYIKTLGEHADRVLPDRQILTTDQPFLDSLSRLLVRTCHRRGALAMGGMSAIIPSKDPKANEAGFAAVRADKLREARLGYDGAWIAHPGLAKAVTSVFDEVMGNKPNQLDAMREADPPTKADDLLATPEGPHSEGTMRRNIRVSLQYIEAWLRGLGCVPIYGLMEDAATAEISRTSVWQWLRHGQKLDDGRVVDGDLFQAWLPEEMEQVRSEIGSERYDSGRFGEAAGLLHELVLGKPLCAFLTLPAYAMLDAH